MVYIITVAVAVSVNSSLPQLLERLCVDKGNDKDTVFSASRTAASCSQCTNRFVLVSKKDPFKIIGAEFERKYFICFLLYILNRGCLSYKKM